MEIRNLSRCALVWLAIAAFIACPWVAAYADNPKMTSAGSTFNRGDFTSTNAFFWSSLDLSQLAGIDTGSANNYIVVVDGAGKVATGYLAGVGAGETLGSELIIDGDFSSALGWTAQTGWSIADGFGVGTNADGYLYRGISPDISKLYKIVYDLVYTSGNFNIFTDGYRWAAEALSGTKTYYRANITGADNFRFEGNSAGEGLFTGTVDNASYKQVTDPPSTAVHIVSSLNGTVRNWASIESGFNPNSIASWVIYGSTPMTRIGHSRGPVNSGITNSGVINSGIIK